MKLLRPATSAEACRLLLGHPGAVPLAGGTDFMVAWNAGEANGRTILDLSRLSSLASWGRIRKTKTGLSIGALATHWDLQNHAAVSRRFPLLPLAAATIGGRQIQTRGTLGGNIANASPAADTFPPLAVYDARVRVVSAESSRVVPFLEIFAGVKKTSLGPGELIVSIELDFVTRPTRQLFRKVGTRAASAISKTVAAGLLWLRKDDRVRELRFSLGSMAPTVRRLTKAEELVRGKKLTPRLVEDAVALLEEDVSPIDDVRSTREYRLEVSRNLLRTFLRP